jgi:serine/threonine protein phosphatase PrpC
VEIKKQDLLLDDAVLLCTDGFLHAVASSASGEDVLKNTLVSKKLSQLETMLNDADEPDDIGYIHYTRTRR